MLDRELVGHELKVATLAATVSKPAQLTSVVEYGAAIRTCCGFVTPRFLVYHRPIHLMLC